MTITCANFVDSELDSLITLVELHKIFDAMKQYKNFFSL